MKRDELSVKLADFVKLCRKRHLPVTVQRRAIFAAVVGTTSHPTADAIYGTVRKRIPGMSRTTVYRCLDVLTETGLVKRLCHPANPARFDGDTSPHHHMVCCQCGAVIDVHDPCYDSLPPPRESRGERFAIEECAITFKGKCRRCTESN